MAVLYPINNKWWSLHHCRLHHQLSNNWIKWMEWLMASMLSINNNILHRFKIINCLSILMFTIKEWDNNSRSLLVLFQLNSNNHRDNIYPQDIYHKVVEVTLLNCRIHQSSWKWMEIMVLFRLMSLQVWLKCSKEDKKTELERFDTYNRSWTKKQFRKIE